MPITWEVDWDRGVVRTAASGDITLAELRDMVRGFMAAPELPKPYREVWDGTRVRRFRPDPTGIREIISLVRANHRFAGGRIAVVAGDHDLLYGMARVAEGVVDMLHAPFAMRVFRGVSEAESWVFERASMPAIAIP